jgi:hypothetical protein
MTSSRLGVTYKEPKDNRMQTAIFVICFNCIFQTITPGKTAHAMSVAMEDAVEKYERPIMTSMLVHVALPSRTKLVSQFASIGRQRHNMPMIVARKVQTINPSNIYTHTRSALIGLPTRSIVMQIEALIKTREKT